MRMGMNRCFFFGWVQGCGWFFFLWKWIWNNKTHPHPVSLPTCHPYLHIYNKSYILQSHLIRTLNIWNIYNFNLIIILTIRNQVFISLKSLHLMLYATNMRYTLLTNSYFELKTKTWFYFRKICASNQIQRFLFVIISSLSFDHPYTLILRLNYSNNTIDIHLF